MPVSCNLQSFYIMDYQYRSSLFRAISNISRRIRRKKGKEKTVYFISGMCYNCKVFDQLRLPRGFRKQYIEWSTPQPEETLEEYSRKMASCIDTTRPFYLVGYSFGAVIMQEMLHFLQPHRSIIISSFKDKSEIPGLFQIVKNTHLAELIPDRLFNATDFITQAFNRLIYNASNDELSAYMTVTDPVYIRWAVEQITQWIPETHSQRLYHIHGTEDQIFPFTQINNALPVEDGDHLMVLKKAETVSSLLSSILLLKE